MSKELMPITQSASAAGERRRHHRVREVLEDALALIEPLFDPANNWENQQLDHLAYCTRLRDAYPELSLDEAHVLVVAAHRAFAHDNTHPSPRATDA